MIDRYVSHEKWDEIKQSLFHPPSRNIISTIIFDYWKILIKISHYHRTTKTLKLQLEHRVTGA